jgi:hypothetical protein
MEQLSLPFVPTAGVTPAEVQPGQHAKRVKAPKILTLEEMRNLIWEEAQAAGNVNTLCRNLHIASPTPVYLALKRKREVPDDVSLSFGFIRTTMYRRIRHATYKA